MEFYTQLSVHNSLIRNNKKPVVDNTNCPDLQTTCQKSNIATCMYKYYMYTEIHISSKYAFL